MPLSDSLLDVIGSHNPRPATRFWKIGCAVMLCFLSGCGVWLGFAIEEAREAARRSQCTGCLNQLWLAFHRYHDVYDSFPPAYVADAHGQPMHSWRVLILPFIDGEKASQQYNFNEPWNSPANQRVASLNNPHTVRCPSGKHAVGSGMTDYVVVMGDLTAFPYHQSTSMEDFADGTENTILLVEIANSDIHWIEPRDLDWKTMSFQVNDPQHPSISAPHAAGPVVVFADSLQGYRLAETLRPETLRALLTINGGEPVVRKPLETWSPQMGRQLAD